MTLSPETLRKDFPLLNQKVRGQSLIYFDNASTTQKPSVVIDTETSYYKTSNANVHRGLYHLSEQATLAYEDARKKVANFIHADQNELIFTKNATESLNVVAYSLLSSLKPGDEISVSLMEHHSNFVPWQQLAHQFNLKLNIIELKHDGTLDFSTFSKKSKVLAITHVSNVLGTINPLKEIITQAHAQGALCIVDACQSAPHLPLDVRELDCDFLVFSSHKLYGPTGIGVLYGKKSLLSRLRPFLYGGDMIREVTRETTTFNELPWKFEAGTPPIASGIAFGAALDYLTTLGFHWIQSYEQDLTSYAVKALTSLPALTVYGPKERAPVISFAVKNIHPHDLAAYLDRYGVALRGGHHCAMPLMKHLGVTALNRISFSFYNTKHEIDAFVVYLKKAIEVLS